MRLGLGFENPFTSNSRENVLRNNRLQHSRAYQILIYIQYISRGSMLTFDSMLLGSGSRTARRSIGKPNATVLGGRRAITVQACGPAVDLLRPADLHFKKQDTFAGVVVN